MVDLDHFFTDKVDICMSYAAVILTELGSIMIC